MAALPRRSPLPHALLALLAAACGDDGPPPADPCEYIQCDITDPACVEQVAETVACHLEHDPIYPTVRMLSPEEYLAEQKAQSTTEPTAAQLRDRDDYLRMEGLVGLMPEGYKIEDSSADYVSNFAAFYSPRRKDIVILTGRANATPESDYVILIHEMVHAYQDAIYDLTTLAQEHTQTWDRELGFDALIEGNAVLYQNFAYIALDGNDVLEIDWPSYFATWQEKNLRNALASDTPALDTNAYFPYAFGGQFVFDAWNTGGPPEVAELYQRPPDSVRQVVAGFSAWPDLVHNEDGEFDPHAVAVMPAAYEIFSGGHESVWSINAMLQRTAQGGLWSPELADISADYLAAWRWNDDEVVAMWRMRSSRPDDLDALLIAGSKWRREGDQPTTHLLTAVDDDVLLIAVTAGDARTVLADITGWQSPEEAYKADAGAPRRPHRHELRDLACAPPTSASPRR